MEGAGVSKSESKWASDSVMGVLGPDPDSGSLPESEATAASADDGDGTCKAWARSEAERESIDDACPDRFPPTGTKEMSGPGVPWKKCLARSEERRREVQADRS